MALQMIKLLLLLGTLDLVHGSCENCADCHGVVCYRCNPGYFQLPDSTCILCQEDCQKCYNASSCKECDVNFWLDYDGSCSACNAGCFYCSNVNDCSICRHGYYLDNDECMNCPSNCAACSSVSQCNSCIEGHWGETCDNICLEVCKTDNCTIEGHCLECLAGYWGQSCTTRCPVNCVNSECGMEGHCTDGCKPGYYDRNCESSCPNSCNTNECDNNGFCIGCKGGYYGPDCKHPCLTDSCVNNECFQSNGTCITSCPENCLTCNTLSNCTSCESGYFGPVCQSECSQGCKECENSGLSCSSCLQGFYLDGAGCKACGEGCVNCSWSDNCNVCVDGYFLEDSIRCRQCPLNCTSCNSSSLCLSCKDGFYGQNCNSVCLDSCKTCEKANTCTTCIITKYSAENKHGNETCQCEEGKCSNKNGDICNSCNALGWFPSGPGCCPCGLGYYIDNNACIPCPEHCTNQGHCNISTGKCLDGCEDGWWGDRCDIVCPEACNGCSHGGICQSCSAGFYGNFCEMHCARNCATDGNTNCDRYTGRCDSCNPGFYGSKCEITCSEGCGLDDSGYMSCKKQDGACNAECLDGYTGSSCIKPQESTGGGIDSNILIIAAGGGGLLLLIIIIIVVVVCVVRTRNAKMKESHEQNGYVLNTEETAQNGQSATKNTTTAEGDIDDSEEYTINPTYIPLSEAQVSRRGYGQNIAPEDRYIIADEQRTNSGSWAINHGNEVLVQNGNHNTETDVDGLYSVSTKSKTMSSSVSRSSDDAYSISNRSQKHIFFQNL